MNVTDREKLVNAGYDVDGALARFVNNEVLFLTFLRKFPDDSHYPEIEPAVKNKDYDGAYKAAHAIKGVAGNLGINPVFESVEKLLNAIKNKETLDNADEKINELYVNFSKTYEEASDIIKSIE